MTDIPFNTRISPNSFEHGSLATLSRAVENLFDVGLLLAAALVAFEIFNFKTTQYALVDLLGDVSFSGFRWATILAIAFCSIDVAGLLRFLMLDQQGENRLEAWYLMGAWLLGATMNAFMAWWAVSVTLINNAPNDGFLSQIPFLEIVPVAVAVLVWLMRIIFIGAFAATAATLFGGANGQDLAPLRIGPRSL